jgi:hypothetical protein
MHDQLQSIRTSVSFSDQHWTTSSPADSLTAIHAESDRLLGRLAMQLAALTDQAAAIQESLRACEVHALHLDAWVDDALFRGDPTTARICSARALLLRDELELIASDVQRLAQSARHSHEHICELGSRLRE